MSRPGDKTIAINRRARRDYDILDSMEAGLVLTGTEIKSVRDGKANLGDAYARPEEGELWLHNMHITEYAAGSIYNHEPRRRRKLLMHRELDEGGHRLKVVGLAAYGEPEFGDEFQDIVDGENVREETDKVTGLSQRIIVEARGDNEPIYNEAMPSGETGNRRAEIFLE